MCIGAALAAPEQKITIKTDKQSDTQCQHFKKAFRCWFNLKNALSSACFLIFFIAIATYNSKKRNLIFYQIAFVFV